MNGFYDVYSNGENGYIIYLNGVLKKESFLGQSHLRKFTKGVLATNKGTFTIFECKNEYSFNKVKNILDSNLSSDIVIGGCTKYSI